MKKNVYFVQVDVPTGKESKTLYLPYTAGVIIANAFKSDEIKDTYEFKNFIFGRKVIESVVAEMDNPAVVGFTNYSWNTEYNLALAKLIKERFPDCINVFGGHNVPHNTSFLDEYNFIDYLTFGEGEITFGALLSAINNGDVSSVPNIAYRKNGNGVMTEIKSICAIDYASPYLDGWFDKILEDNPDVEFNSIIETSRGCPNSCAYCDWGPLKEKTRYYPLERILAEIEWLGQNKIRFIWAADANFGMNKDDLTIADAFVNAKKTYGYPERVRFNYSKAHSERVREIIKRFNSMGLDREGATISLQSLSPVVLENIGRKNMSLDHFRDQFSRYYEEGLQGYSELILGLPGETYDSFVDGICKLFEIGQHFIFEVYNCLVLPNSGLGQPEYMKKHGIKTTNCEPVRPHCTADSFYIPERINIITETNTMSNDAWQKSGLFAAFTQAMHACGLIRCLAIYSFKECKTSYRQFYEGLMRYIEAGNAPFLNESYRVLKNAFAELANGISYKLFLSDVDNITWEHYEYMFISISKNPDVFYNELMPYFKTIITDEELLKQLVDYQKSVLRRPGEETAECITNYNFNEYFQNIYINKYSPLVKGKFKTVFTDISPVYNWEDFGKFVVWYAKMGSKSYKKQIEVTEI